MLNLVDIAFVVDTTASMGGFLNSAKTRMSGIITELATSADIDLRVVLIDYRDHPPQDGSYPAKLQTGKTPVSVQSFDRTLRQMNMGSGGDHAESVLDGVDMLTEVEWREHSRRIAFLVGDAPAHGYAASVGRYGGDAWPKGCPCGKTAESVSGNLEDLGILLYGIVVSADADAQKCFELFSSLTGGSMVRGDGITEVKRLLGVEFGSLGFDAKVNEIVDLSPDWTVLSIARSLSASPQDVESSVIRLLSRDIIRDPAAVSA